MGNDIPRRLKRFQRKADSGEELPEEALLELEMQENENAGGGVLTEGAGHDNSKKKTMELALKEVKRFKSTHKRLPKKEEYDTIAESIYAQLKEQEEKERILRKMDRIQNKTSRKHPRKSRDRRNLRKSRETEEPEPMEPKSPLASKKLEKKPESSALESVKGLDVGDLFGESAKKPGAKQEGELEELTGLDFGEDTELKSLGSEEKSSANACPNCKKAADSLIYCPGCGTAYCAACAKSVEKLAGRTKFTCPKCGRSIEK
ncbi:MAG: hypothetical protein QGI60_01335 [archaeon]|nr:hypothetical protein [archaeon]